MQKDTTTTAEHVEPTLAELREVANRVLLRQLDETRALAERLQAERDARHQTRDFFGPTASIRTLTALSRAIIASK